ncbi:MAG: hypothetical protein QOD71_3183 [Thermoleophilaceae bacterium]|jgi:hypothetical protein|nr:hypothetical protein [Thermoleophilaceae bacterium]
MEVAEIVDSVQQLPSDKARQEAVASVVEALGPESGSQAVTQSLAALPADKAKDAVAAAGLVGQLGRVAAKDIAFLWKLVIGGFVALLLGGTVLVFVLVLSGERTEVIAPLVTGALGVLAGLLAQSPTQSSGGTG